ncbi:MAG TPA: glucose-6-phosphate dehydrogenase [Methylomirabilota bacterium]|jgi:glucose-6-phosphate 1-dehydrogenase|nr:glucose-6-phosphate dehydrogenase [Methylomirabilota bacterium]
MSSSDDPFSLIIFGASGDLAHRKLIPALWSLYAARTLPEPFHIIGTGRTEMSNEAFRTKMREGVKQFARLKVPNDNVWSRFANSLSYVAGDPTGPDLYGKLRERIEEVERGREDAGNRLYYLSTPPSLYDPIVGQLGKAGLAAEERGWTRIIIEKPFGHDLRSAQELNQLVTSVFREDQVYRIDHYLGKETVQNVLALRFANGILEPLWNRNHVAEVQFTVAEKVGVEGRGGYYEESGALRDMIQNHLLQVMCLVAMEPPVTFDAQAVRDEKSKVMQAIHPIDPGHVERVALRAQYGSGFVDGRPVPGYLQEKGVKPDSKTETYAALRLQIDNWRWAGVPFYLQTGKRMATRVSEIVIRFHRTPHMIFRRGEVSVHPNLLVIRIQPDEGISLIVEAKEPGPDLKIAPVTLDFKYHEVFGGEPPEAYERLLLDAVHGDPTLYSRGDWIEQSWQLTQPIIDHWAQPSGPLPQYEAGGWGPPEAEAFIARDGGAWRRP